MLIELTTSILLSIEGAITAVAPLAAPIASSVGVVVVLWMKNSNDTKLKDLKVSNEEEHEVIRVDQLEIKSDVKKLSSYSSPARRFEKIADDAEDILGSNDPQMTILIRECVDISIKFFNSLKAGGIHNKHASDVVRASNANIQTIANNKKNFGDDEFIEFMWPDFEQMGVEAQADFIAIIEEKLINGKEDALIREIENFLYNLFKMLVRKRIAYLG